MDHSREEQQGRPAAPVVHVQEPSPTTTYATPATTPLWCSLHGRWLAPGRPLFYNRGTEFWLLVR